MIARFDRSAGYPQLLQRFQRTEALLMNNGINLPSGCRWQKYKDILMKACQGSVLSPTDRRDLPEALIECENFIFAIASVAAPPEIDGWEKYAQKIIGGPVTANSERKNTPARDTQSELFVAALLHRGGLRVTFGEPDILVDLPDGYARLGIAVKRLKSDTQLRANTKKAVQQLRSSSVEGLPALDLAFFRSMPISAPDLQVAGELLLKETRNYTERNREVVMKAVGSGGQQHAIGLLFASAKIAFLEGMNEPAAVFCLCVDANASDRRNKLVEKIVAGLESSGRIWVNG